MIHFISIEDCFFQIFPGIKKHLASKNNPVPNYENEFDALAELEARLKIVKNHYYKNFWDKSAYLFVSVAEGHFFSNGNKRLALSLLAKFYEINFIVKENFHTKNLAKSWEIYSQNII